MKLVIDGKTMEIPTGSGPGEEVYSTEETRIGTWIDGKPLYRITFTVGDVRFPIGDQVLAIVEPPANIKEIPFDTMVNAQISFKGLTGDIGDTNTQHYMVGPGAILWTYRIRDKKCLTMAQTLSMSKVIIANSVWITFDYTKTTDQGVSI